VDKPCDHYWFYDHCVYAGVNQNDEDDAVIHRQCSQCGIHQHGRVRKWRTPYSGYKLVEIVGDSDLTDKKLLLRDADLYIHSGEG